jgi:23S rRNA pseudouridine1911/1915/1917 synthase
MSQLEVLHENKDYIVINKTAGLISEQSPFEESTAESLVQKHLQTNKRMAYVGVIHRLDRVTSGVKKTYWAVVHKKPAQNKGTLTHFLLKNNRKKIAEIVPTKIKGAQECSLSYQVLEQNNLGYLLEIKPKTGRFHQIRAQLAHIGLPIIGDEKYGSDQKYLTLSICLHARKLIYRSPDSSATIAYEAPVPNNKYWNFKSI